MRFAFDEEQEEFRASLAALLADRVTGSGRRDAIEAQGDDELWKTLVSEMGVPSLHVPEDQGGQGFTVLETAVVMTELGRALAPVPVLSSTLALEAALHGGAPSSVVAALASGEAVGAVAARDASELAGTGTALVAESSGGTVTISGAVLVPDGASADMIVVAARSSADATIGHYLIDARTESVQADPVASLDLTRPHARVVFTNAPAIVLDSAAAVPAVTQLARLLLAFESIGTAERALDLAVDYAKNRKQFNRAIGSFQAIKHKCANVAVEIDLAIGAAMYAAMLANDGDVEAFSAAAIANAQASEALSLAAAELLQVLGGIGFTWEHDGHLFFRRAKANEVLFGSPQQLRIDNAGTLAS